MAYLIFSTLDKIFSRRYNEVLFLFSQKTGFDFSCKLSLISNGDTLHEMSNPVFQESLKKFTNLSPTELAPCGKG